MRKIKNIFFSIITALLCLAPVIKAEAATPVNVYFFYGDGCGFCGAAEEWFEKLDEDTLSKINLVRFEVWNNSNNSALLTKTAEHFDMDTSKVGIPFIVIGDQTVVGFAEGTTSDRILELVDDLYEKTNRYDLADHVDLSTGTAEGNLLAPSNKTSDTTVILALVIIIVGVVGLLTYAKIKTN